MLEVLRKEVVGKARSEQDQIAEDALWDAFDMDLFTDKMVNGLSTNEADIFMGTGYTLNACYNCGGSAYSANQVDCCR